MTQQQEYIMIAEHERYTRESICTDRYQIIESLIDELYDGDICQIAILARDPEAGPTPQADPDIRQIIREEALPCKR